MVRLEIATTYNNANANINLHSSMVRLEIVERAKRIGGAI